MFGLQILDLVIGLIFIYFLLSLVCSTIQEIIANISGIRYRVLKNWVLKTFQHNGFGNQILNHHVIQGLTRTNKPSYIPSDKFVQAVLDMVHSQVHGDKAFDINSLRDAMDKTILLPPGLKRFVLQSIAEAKGEISKVRSDFAKWFDDAMERVGGFYKKRVQVWIFIISIFVVIAFRADTIELVRYLYAHPAVASALADQAEKAVNDPDLKRRVDELRNRTSADTMTVEVQDAVKNIEANIAEIKSIATELKETKMPLGWGEKITLGGFFRGIWKSLPGLLITMMAVSLGAPFWFDLLSKLASLRNAGKKPEVKNT